MTQCSGRHYECDERVSYALSQLVEQSVLSKCKTIPTREATLGELTLAHDQEYIEKLLDTVNEYVK